MKATPVEIHQSARLTDKLDGLAYISYISKAKLAFSCFAFAIEGMHFPLYLTIPHFRLKYTSFFWPTH